MCGEHRGLVALDRAIDGVGQRDRALLARVVAALVDRHLAQAPVVDAEARHDRPMQILGRMIEWQPQVGDAQHRRVLKRTAPQYRSGARARSRPSKTLRCG
jgi:hypothetical protein